MFGIDPNVPFAEKEFFDPLDNDYVRFVWGLRDVSKETLERVGKPNYMGTNADYEIVRCSD